MFAIKEKLPVLNVHSKLTMHELMINCYNHTSKLNIIPILKGLRVSVNKIEKEEINADYFIINIKLKEKVVNIMAFPSVLTP